MFQFVERNELARAVEADQIAHPAQQRNVRDGVVIAHDPLPPGETLLENGEQALRFRAIAFERTFVFDVLAGELKEIDDLSEHRSDAAHLEEHPRDRLHAPRGIGWQELAGLLGEIEKDRARSEEPERLAVRVGDQDRRNSSRWD